MSHDDHSLNITARIMTDTPPWTAEDVLKAQAVEGPVAVALCGDSDCCLEFTMSCCPHDSKEIVRNIAKAFPGKPVHWSTHVKP